MRGSLALLAWVAFTLLWHLEAVRRRQAIVRDAQARGEPILPEDYDIPKVPDEENAAVSLRRGAERIQFSKDFGAYILRLRGPVWPLHTITVDDVRKDPEPFQQHLAENGEALALIRRARGQRRVDWGIRPRPPFRASEVYPDSIREILNNDETLLTWAARYRQATGDGREFVNCLRDLLGMQDARPSAQFGKFGYRDSLDSSFLVCQLLEDAAPNLKIRGTADDPSSRAAGRTQVKALIEALLDEVRLRDAARTACLCERTFNLNRFSTIASYGFFRPMPLRPAAEVEAVRVLEDCTSAMTVVGEPSWPAAMARRLQSQTHPESTLEYFTHVDSGMYRRGTDEFLLSHFRAIAARRVAAVMLAVRLYRVDHGGFPRTLGELVPEYLPSLPADPFSPGGASFGYRRKNNPPVVYSVSRNGVDDGGVLPWIPDTSPWRFPDAAFRLGPLPAPATAPSTQAHDDNAKVDGDSRDDQRR